MTLPGEISWNINRKWLSRVWFLRTAEPAFVLQLALHLVPVVLAPGELVTRRYTLSHEGVTRSRRDDPIRRDDAPAPGELAPTGNLYIVHRGIALYGGKVLTAGKVWGEDLILSNEALRRNWCARAMNYLEVRM